MYIEVRELRGDLVSLPVARNSLISVVVHIEQRTLPNLSGVDISHTLLVVVVYIVANAGTHGETEIPVLPFHTRRKTHDNRSCGALVEVLVGLSNLSVTIAVDNDILDGLAIIVVGLLEYIE